MIFIFSYNREQMLKKTLKPIKAMKPFILDDGSCFSMNYDRFLKLTHGGKQLFWRKWELAFDLAKASDDDFFLFMPDDFTDIKIGDILTIHEQLNHEPYVYNIINDGRDAQWTAFNPKQVDEYTIRIGFTDCGFFCNRKALDAIKWKIDPVNPLIFKRNPHMSSGVGQQLTSKFFYNDVAMYKPVRSLAYHGDHISQMHPLTRPLNPLISI
jgi:hypothetical protein